MEFEPLSAPPGQRNTWLKRIATVLGLLLAGGLIVAMLYSFLHHGGARGKQIIHEIALIKPPPPPPPKPAEKPPEPEIKKEVVKVDQPKPDEPKPLPEAPPPLKDLGVVGQGVAGGDLFGLGARSGGVDLIKSAPLESGGGAGGVKLAEKKSFGWYTSQVQLQFQEALGRNPKLQGRNYRVVVRVWLAGDGRVKRVDMLDSTGNAQLDSSLKLALSEVPKLAEAPPQDMPQPVKMRITSRT
jgi:periplasmic protein TonB